MKSYLVISNTYDQQKMKLLSIVILFSVPYTLKAQPNDAATRQDVLVYLAQLFETSYNSSRDQTQYPCNFEAVDAGLRGPVRVVTAPYLDEDGSASRDGTVVSRAANQTTANVHK